MNEPALTGLNHLTFAVSDLERSIHFYRDVLGCRICARWESGAYLEIGATWLCLSSDPATRQGPHADYTHAAFSVDAADFDALSAKIRERATIWRDNRSEGGSLYFLDPDGHKLEIHLGSLASRLAHYDQNPPPRYERFD
ncbi:VOC family protein [Sphingomonas sp. SUN019]|uniref:VOC family protein n=1 Tax=Sphingomonas sp. SUN019 TaxID=2937788 RepID=UPI00216444A5|nr:VOC family protein [Sphingomonas sp. SUN019]UVO51818.1 VOC family protein [Sphingomonas sp. SUN019]